MRAVRDRAATGVDTSRTIIRLQISMQNLRPLLLLLYTPWCSPTQATLAMWMMTIIKCKQKLHEIIPYRILWYWPPMSLRLFDDTREVAATAILHEDIQDTGLSVDVAVMISYNVVMVQVFEDVSGGPSERTGHEGNVHTHTSATICFRSRSDMRSKLSSFLANI